MLSDIPTKDLMKEIKKNPKNIPFLIELEKRLDNDELDDAELIKLLDVMLSIGGG